jgi:hypothetical protein
VNTYVVTPGRGKVQISVIIVMLVVFAKPIRATNGVVLLGNGVPTKGGRYLVVPGWLDGAMTTLGIVETPLPDLVGTRLVLTPHISRGDLGLESVELATRGWDRRVGSPVDDRDDSRGIRSRNIGFVPVVLHLDLHTPHGMELSLVILGWGLDIDGTSLDRVD